MQPMFFVFIPSYDEVMDQIYKWSYELIELSRVKFSDNILVHVGKDANRENLIKALKQFIPLNYIAAHGKPDRLVIRVTDETLIHMDELTEDMCKNKIFYFISCSLGKEFGRKIADLGGGFIGYVEDLIFTYTDSFQRVLLEPINQLIHKKTIREAYELTLKAYDEEIERLKNATDPLLVQTRILLEYNKENLVYYGDPNMKIEYLDLTIAKLLAVTQLALQLYLPFRPYLRKRRIAIV